MAACVENNQESSNAWAIVPFCPVVLDVEPLSTYANSHVSGQFSSTYEENVINNNVILNPVPISQYEPVSRRSRKRKLRSSKVIDISYNNRFIRRVIDGEIKYLWERDGPTSNTIPMVHDEGFKHELLEDWTVESRIRQDGYTKERYFTHPKARPQFRSIRLVQKFLARKIDVPKKIEEDKKAKKIAVEKFLAESYENLMNYYADQKKP